MAKFGFIKKEPVFIMGIATKKLKKGFLAIQSLKTGNTAIVKSTTVTRKTNKFPL